MSTINNISDSDDSVNNENVCLVYKSIREKGLINVSAKKIGTESYGLTSRGKAYYMSCAVFYMRDP